MHDFPNWTDLRVSDNTITFITSHEPDGMFSRHLLPVSSWISHRPQQSIIMAGNIKIARPVWLLLCGMMPAQNANLSTGWCKDCLPSSDWQRRILVLLGSSATDHTILCIFIFIKSRSHPVGPEEVLFGTLSGKGCTGCHERHRKVFNYAGKWDGKTYYHNHELLTRVQFTSMVSEKKNKVKNTQNEC